MQGKRDDASVANFDSTVNCHKFIHVYSMHLSCYGCRGGSHAAEYNPPKLQDERPAPAFPIT